MQKSCKQCGIEFIITDNDFKFYDKVSPIFNGVKYTVPSPTLCSDCRKNRRFSFRNERKLYHRKCDFSGRQIIAMYSQDKSFTVYDPEEWWSDKWDALEYGQEFDFNRPFFEQFYELMLKVPRMSLGLVNVENSDYCNYTGDLKNCYLCYGSIFAEDCYYGSPYYCQNCVDILVSRDCKFCYECVDSEKLTECFFCQDCYNSNNLLYCYDCQGCEECIGCSGLRQSKYCIFNEKLSKEEYFKRKKKLELNHKNLGIIKKRFEEIRSNSIRKFSIQHLCEYSTGNYLTECQNVDDSFYVRRAKDAKFLAQTIDIKDSFDVNYMEDSELIYDSFGAYHNYKNLFCNTVYESSNMIYCDWCMNNSDSCFGCISLKRKKYCILNKQYTKEKYEELVPKIIECMEKAREWGEFFPVSISPFGYNETVAQEYFPLLKDQVLSNNWNWKDEEDGSKNYMGPKIEVPNNISDTDESICEKILQCDETGKLYKIIPQEFYFYKRMGLPVPKICPDQRHKNRLSLRNPQKLWERNCAECYKQIKTSYSPEMPEKVLCEECYLKETY